MSLENTMTRGAAPGIIAALATLGGLASRIFLAGLCRPFTGGTGR